MFQVMCDEYRKPFQKTFQNGGMRFLEISLLDKAVFVFMQNWIESNLKKDVSADRHVLQAVIAVQEWGE